MFPLAPKLGGFETYFILVGVFLPPAPSQQRGIEIHGPFGTKVRFKPHFILARVWVCVRAGGGGYNSLFFPLPAGQRHVCKGT